MLALAACGGGGAADTEQVVRDFSKAMNESDGKRLCEELVTQEFVEQITLARGDSAREQCKDQVKALKTRTFKIVKITSTKVKGDTATVTAEIEQQGQRRPQVFRLKKEDGDFRLTSAQ